MPRLQALERIRKVAKERKKERFTALFHHISIDLLDEAFYELKENVAAGVDGLTWPLLGRHAQTVRGVLAVTQSGQDPPDRIRPIGRIAQK
jgi:hypothetical protein